MSKLVRQIHRLTSIAFLLVVASYTVAIAGFGLKQPPAWLNMAALLPLFVLMGSGLYMLVRPYVAKWRDARRPADVAAMAEAS